MTIVDNDGKGHFERRRLTTKVTKYGNIIDDIGVKIASIVEKMNRHVDCNLRNVGRANKMEQLKLIYDNGRQLIYCDGVWHYQTFKDSYFLALDCRHENDVITH